LIENLLASSSFNSVIASIDFIIIRKSSMYVIIMTFVVELR
jgi:hypothetical protein